MANTLAVSKVGGLVQFWKGVRSLDTDNIEQEANRPFQVTLVGSTEQTAQLAERLRYMGSSPSPPAVSELGLGSYVSYAAEMREVPVGGLFLDAAMIANSESALTEALERIVGEKPELALSLARHIPAARSAVSAAMVHSWSWTNAKLAIVSALPGVIPLADILLPATSLGDMILLTRNQSLLVLRLSAAHGLPVNVSARMKELIPVVGGAFGWRSIARELVGVVPGGIGLVVKGTVAYAGTYTVGRAAEFYYRTGRTMGRAGLRKLYRDALADISGRVRNWVTTHVHGRARSSK